MHPRSFSATLMAVLFCRASSRLQWIRLFITMPASELKLPPCVDGAPQQTSALQQLHNR